MSDVAAKPPDIPDLVRSLDRAADDSSDFHDVEELFRRQQGDVNPTTEAGVAVAALIGAFQYLLRHGRTKKGTSPFVPMFEFDNRQIPPRPTDVPESWRLAWSGALERSAHPAVRARLADLLFATRRDSPGRRAKQAVDAYLELAGRDGWSALDRSHGLERAYDIATLTKDAGAKYRVLNAMRESAANELAKASPPGFVLNSVERILESDDMRESALRLLDESLTRYGDNPHLVDDILQLKRRHASVDGQRSIDRNRVENWMVAAETSDGAQRLFHLERAAVLAGDSGLVELRDEAVRRMQAIDRDSLGLERIEAAADLPADAVEQYLGDFVSEQTWQAALVSAALHQPLTGEYEQNLDALEQMRTDAPLSFMLRRVKLGGDGLPRWQPENEEQERDDKLAQHESLRFQLMAPLYAEGLRRLGEHYHVGTSELEAFLDQRSTLGAASARILAKAFALFWSGDHNSAAHVAIWQIEAVARQLLVRADQPVYVVKRTNNQGHYVGLATLLEELARLGLEPSWYRYIRTVFAGPAGMGLRNEIAHGFVREVGAPEAAAILHVVSYLSLLQATTDRAESGTGY